MNEAELVLTQVLNCNRLALYLNQGLTLDQNQAEAVAGIFKRRINGEPLQYILGKCEFMGLEFKVDRRVLIPRPETEILVESVLQELKTKQNLSLKILDLGTGSGCIAIALAKALPEALVWATDISKPALDLAQENANLNKVKIKFLSSDLFKKIRKNKFDLIISNPPYIATGEFQGLAKELLFEPQQALAAGKDGLDFYRQIIDQAGDYLNNGGLLAFEVGYRQARQVAALLSDKDFKQIKIINDYNNIARVVMGRITK